MTEPVETGRGERSERTVAALLFWLGRIRRVPAVLRIVLWSSVGAGLVLAWLWFGSSAHAWVRWLAVPWLAMAAVPQLGLWILASAVRELFELPDRLLAIKSGLAEGGSRVLDKVRREGGAEIESGGFLRTLREAYALHGEIGKVVATRAILHRFTGPMAVLVGPASFVANCVIVALAILSLALRVG
jgi:hypothetical protein